MRTPLSPAASAGRTVARVLGAGLSLAVLLAAVVGLPLLLACATPVIWAATHDDLAHLLDRQDTGAVFLLLLVTVGWIGWAQFTFCAVRELVAQLRGRTWHAPRGLGSSQRAAALLIGSILVLLPASSALASEAQAAPTNTSSVVPSHVVQSPQGATAESGPTRSASSTPSSSTTYTVRQTRPAESLWAIAEGELGDGERWREIADLNAGRTMTDGSVFRANSFLQPGWQLQMPNTGSAGVRTQLDEGTRHADDEDSEHVVTVRAGDYLSTIAQEELGDGNAWPQLFEASRGRPQPNGLPAITDPDLIRPGQQVTVPGTQPEQLPEGRHQGSEPDGQEPPPPAAEQPGEENPGGSTGDDQAPASGRTAAPEAESPAPAPSTSRPDEQPHQGDEASPSASASASVAPEPGSSVSPSDPATTASQTPAASETGSALTLRLVLGAGALLAAAVTGALALRRTLQRRRRTPGEMIAIAPEPSTAEAQLAAAAEPDGAARLDVVLRTLAHQAAEGEGDGTVPLLRAARIGTRMLEVLPEDVAQAPKAPFVSGEGGWWLLPSDAALLEEEAAREVPAPYPGLVTIGSTEAGDLLLLNLAQLPALLLDGNPVHITEVCTSLALELGMSPWAGDVEVVTVGFGEDLPQMLPTARIAHMRQAAHALRDLSERLLEVQQMPETRRQPYLLLCASSLDADTAWQLADTIDKSGPVPVTLVAPASSAAAHFPEAEILNASVDGPQTLDYTGDTITVQRLEHAAYVQISTALRMSGQPPHPAEGPWQDVPAESGRTPQPPVPEEPIVPAAATSPSADADDAGGAFPALLAATTDPSGLRLLPPTAAPRTADGEPGQDAKVPSAAAHPAAGTDTSAQDAAAGPAEDHAKPQTGKAEAHALHAPEIRVLGPVEVDGVAASGHGPRTAQLAALLFFRPGRSADALCSDMDPLAPWSSSTLHARLRGLRSALGNDPEGNAYVPRRRSGDDPFRLAPAVRCDWTRFLQLAERALPKGPAGLPDLEFALELVRGRPFGARPLPWAAPLQQEMITRIIDVAHTVAMHRTPPGPHHDLTAARQAVATGLDADPSAELLYRDWMRIEYAAGNRSGLHTAITQVQQVNRSLDCDLEVETEQLIDDLLHGTGTGLRRTAL
ncbi:LysM peptidoglycan-binding domain-containing protein [Streptomyces chartreusis]|uniref:LysM peptidoglycan-binding domain-containing protein n=1 Tax=Streptomyces chartreusis TaxID=1969 RepID=UPI00167479D3|nr:LysM peptidoglycan-binding domain-containing protein [Streptomyces chartreusis]GGX56362.1 hypothetical protein GCM10010321_87060 [Streptomyces chartreusis]